MATVIPSLRGKIGNTEYFVAKMTAGELVSRIRPANELDGWTTMSIDERMQRDPNLTRIKNELAPYVANTKDRFFGSLIVLVYKGEVTFESLSDLSAKIPQAYKSGAKDIGFVTIDGGSLIVLDGQHRLLALEQVVKNKVTGEFSEDVPNDELSVIFIKHENNEKTRRIFNKTNRYAKPTSRGDNIITSEDDGYAILARRLLDEAAPLGPVSGAKKNDVVDWKHNNLSIRSTQLTTISVVYETVKMILIFSGFNKIDPKFRPSEDELDHYYELAERFWETVLTNLKPYQEALADLSQIPKMRQDTQPHSLLFKPVAQMALFRGLTLAMDGERLTLEEAVKRANDIDWQMTSSVWKGILVRPNNTIDPRSEAINRAGTLISYLIAADKMDEKEKEAIQVEYNKGKGTPTDLPMPVVAAASGTAEAA
jgi:DNA sulfur modification protein DndB